MEFVSNKPKKDIPGTQDLDNSLKEQIKVDEEFEENLNTIFGMDEGMDETEGEEKQ